MDAKKSIIAIVVGVVVSIVVSFIFSLLAPFFGGFAGGMLGGKGIKKGIAFGFIVGILYGIFGAAYTGFLPYSSTSAYQPALVFLLLVGFAAVLGIIGGLIGQHFSSADKKQ